MGSSGNDTVVTASPTGDVPTCDLVDRARALLPRVWVGEDVGEDVAELLREAAERDAPEVECAARFVLVAEASIQGRQDETRRAATALIERARSAGLSLWESRGCHYLARVHLAAGEEAQGIEELVTAEVLTDVGDEFSVSRAGAINGIASTYMLLGLYEDSERLFEELEPMQAELADSWVTRAHQYNRLLNTAHWCVALEQIGAHEDTRRRLSRALERLWERGELAPGSFFEGDIRLLVLFGELLCGLVTVEEGKARLERITAEHQPESESFAHFALASRLADSGRFEEARAEVHAGLDDVHPIEGDQIATALRWLRTRIAVLAESDHAGLQEAWDHVNLMTDKVWELRLRRRDAVLDRLHIRRLRTEHDRVERASLEDHLTGVANRRRLDHERADLDAAVASGWITVIYLDIDHFKTVNDTLGHDLGDEVLRQLAEILGATVRTNDLIGRYGGDEFVIVAHRCDPDAATALGRRIVAAVRNHAWVDLHPSLTIRVSVGVAVTDHAYGRLFAAGDDALYAAKQAGRDQATVRTLDADGLARRI